MLIEILSVRRTFSGVQNYLVEVFRIVKRSLAAEAAIGGMLFVNVFLELVLIAEYAGTLFTSIPVSVLLVF